MGDEFSRFRILSHDDHVFLLSVVVSVNPIYTTDSGSLFLLSATPEEFFGSAQGLCFIIKDYDTLSANDTLGKVFVHQDELLNGEGERTEYDLMESASKNEKNPVRLLRIGRQF